MKSVYYKEARQSLSDEAHDLLRGAAGGLIFGTPLLFTMEMWFHGVTYSNIHLLGLFVLVFVINLAFSYASGMRANYEDHTLQGTFSDTVTAMALGMVLAAIVLALIGQIPEEGFEASLRKIIIEGAAISIGITFTNAKFPCDRSSKDDESENDSSKDKNKKKDEKECKNKSSDLEDPSLSLDQKQSREDLKNLATIMGGALIFTFNIAPTEEGALLATAMEPYLLLLLFIFEIIVCYVILYAADFKEHPVYKDSIIQHPYAEVAITVATSLIVAALLLCLISYDSALANINHFIANLIVLGFPAVIGGSAGRIIV